MTNVVKRWGKYLNRDSADDEGRLALLHHDLYMNKIYSNVKIFMEFLKNLIKYSLSALYTKCFIQTRGHLIISLSLEKKIGHFLWLIAYNKMMWLMCAEAFDFLAQRTWSPVTEWC